MRLIDADTIDDVVQDLNENHNSGITRNEYKRITAVLYEMPTIDAEPVVRCKDCIYKDYSICTHFSQLYIKEDDFCSKGRKRDDE